MGQHKKGPSYSDNQAKTRKVLSWSVLLCSIQNTIKCMRMCKTWNRDHMPFPDLTCRIQSRYWASPFVGSQLLRKEAWILQEGLSPAGVGSPLNGKIPSSHSGPFQAYGLPPSSPSCSPETKTPALRLYSPPHWPCSPWLLVLFKSSLSYIHPINLTRLLFLSHAFFILHGPNLGCFRASPSQHRAPFGLLLLSYGIRCDSSEHNRKALHWRRYRETGVQI